MEYDVYIIAACDADVWNTNTAQFPATVKNLIDELDVDYKFKIVTAGAQKSSWDSDDLLTVSSHFVNNVQVYLTVDSLAKVQDFEDSLATACSKLDTKYKLKIRTKNHIG